MTKSKYISLLKSNTNPLTLLYAIYQSQSPNAVDIQTFQLHLSMLMQYDERSLPDLIKHVCGKMENKLRVWRVTSPNGTFSFA